MNDIPYVNLRFGPLAGSYITEVEPSCDFNAELTYAFAIEIQTAATVCGEPGYLTEYAIYQTDGPGNSQATFVEMTWHAPHDTVVVLGMSEGDR